MTSQTAGFFVGKEVKVKNYDENYNFEKKKEKQWKKEHNEGFRCSHCKWWVVSNAFMGTANRNHCNLCLWSKHVDEKKGDRKSLCQSGMKPIGLTFKQEGHGKQGELMLIHLCSICGKISINRIASDDFAEEIIVIFEESQALDERRRTELIKESIYLLGMGDKEEVFTQLFGR